MTEQLKLILLKLEHLSRMRGYLEYSLSQVEPSLHADNWTNLNPDQHESLAAFRVRFSEFQEHLGKAMRKATVDEEQEADRYGTVLAFIERLKIKILPPRDHARASQAEAFGTVHV